MLKPLLFFLFLLTGTLSFAQIQRGDRLLSSDATGSGFGPIPSTLGGGNVSVTTEPGTMTAQYAATYGQAVLDRLMVGVGVNGYYSYQSEFSGGYTLSPFARYYFLNRERLMVFGQVGSSLNNGPGQSVRAFDRLSLAAGLHLPVAQDVFFTPRLEYTALEGRNIFGVGAGLDIRLRDSEDGEKAIGRVAEGQIMLGAESAGLGFRRNSVSGSFRVGGHYFLTDRLAAGVRLGAGFSRYDPEITGYNLRSSNLDLGASARYYFNNERHVLWFAEAGGGRAWQTNRIAGDPSSFNFSYLSAGGGAQIFLRERVSLEVAPQLDYNFATEKLGAGLKFGFRFSL